MKQVQSYNSILLKCNFSIYELRILLAIVRRAQPLYQGHLYSDVFKNGICTDGLNMNFSIPLSDMLLNKSHNYGPLKAAILRMEKEWHVQYYDNRKKAWFASSMIYNVQLYETKGIFKFSCPKWLIDYIADFRNGGYRVYDYEHALELRNPNTARLYMLFSNDNTKIHYISIDDLKSMFGLENKYKRADSFIKRVIEPAKKQLEEKGYNGFSYDIVRENPDRKRSPIIGINFYPVKREKRNIEQERMEIFETIPEVLKNYLSYQVGFTYAEIAHNRKTIADFCKLDAWQDKFSEIIDRTRRKRRNHGYIINSFKKEILKSNKQ